MEQWSWGPGHAWKDPIRKGSGPAQGALRKGMWELPALPTLRQVHPSAAGLR